MAWLLSLFGGIWGRLIAVLIAVASVLAAVLTVRAKVRGNAQRELSESIQRRTLERIEEARHAQDDAAAVPDDTIRERLRDMGYLRDGD